MGNQVGTLGESGTTMVVTKRPHTHSFAARPSLSGSLTAPDVDGTDSSSVVSSSTTDSTDHDNVPLTVSTCRPHGTALALQSPQQSQSLPLLRPPHDKVESVTCSPSGIVRLLSRRASRPESFVFLDDDEDNDDTMHSQIDNHNSADDDSWMVSACSPRNWKSSWAGGTATTNETGRSFRNRDHHHNYPDSCAPRTPSRSSSWLSFTADAMDYTDAELALSGTQPTYESDLARPRPVFIVTTAALPWMTGTAVNPLLRAAYLTLRNAARCPHQDCDGTNNSSNAITNKTNTNTTVTLVIPWLESAADRVLLYGDAWKHATTAVQETFIREWLVTRASLTSQQAHSVVIVFYPARYHHGLSSIFAMGDFCERLTVPDDAVCLLEEPEHINCYRAPGKTSWRKKFAHVVGIIHTNYKAYASHHYSGLLTGPLVGVLSSWCVRAYCDKVIKLSPVLQTYAAEKETVCNVHGIRDEFLHTPAPTGPKIYFLGKLLWAKGLDKMLRLQYAYRKATGSYFAMDVFGSGPEEKEIRKAFLGEALEDDDVSSVGSKSTFWKRRVPLPVQFLGRQDHGTISTDYKIMVNPSITEVLCTSTAEAVAMSKFVILPTHPSNVFFEQFPNCLFYETPADFCRVLQHATSHNPEPLTPECRDVLSWSAATTRLLEAGQVSERDAARRDRIGQGDERIAEMHYKIFQGHTGDVLRKVLGGGPVADQFKYESQIRHEAKTVRSTLTVVPCG
jgi:digalactosyldiacylglycerol synthase